MTSRIQQFKIILWKNFKIFKQKTSIFGSAFEIFLTFIIICTLSIRSKEEIFYDKEASKPAENTLGAFVLFNEAHHGYDNSIGALAFVLPTNSSFGITGDEFISLVMNNPSLKLASELKSMKFNSEKELDDFVNDKYSEPILAGVVFDDDYTDYSIRIKGNEIIDSKKNPINNYSESRRSEYVDYLPWIPGYEYMHVGITDSDSYAKTYIYIQNAVDNAIIQIKTKGKVLGYSVDIGKLSKPAIFYDANNKEENRKKFDGFAPYIALLFIGQIFHLSNRLMEEKENKTRDGLISIGVPSYLLWMTWEIIYLPLSLILMTMSILFDPAKILSSVNPLLIVLLFLFYVLSMYNLVVIISHIMKRGKDIVVITCLFVAFIISINKILFNLKFGEYGWITKLIGAILTPVGVSMAAAEFSIADNFHKHIGLSNMFETDFGYYFLWVVADAFIYFFIALLFDYFRGVSFRTVGYSKSKLIKNVQSVDYSQDIQEDPVGSECYVQVKDLYKFFKFRRSIDNDSDDKKLGKVFAANKNVNFKVYKDEIFAILGHNGAGKSTLIQNMVGIIKPDGGETFYQGLPLTKFKKLITKQIGICTQSNVLFEEFTVADHFKLFSGIKGVEGNVDEWLENIDLVEKKNYNVSKLSGGQKRKLCIGLALIGDPKYVFLDEPTTGLDPLSRRKIWNLLLKVKKDRVIFITTHYMDEADIIADRKLILNKGSIRCLGSSVYLKNHFQMKYNLEVETNNPQSIGNIITQYVPEAVYFNDKTLIDEKRGTITTHIWKLPIQMSSHFSSLMKALEAQKGINLINFSLNAPLLEELFVGLERDMESKNANYNNDNNNNNAIELPEIDKIKRPGILNTALRLCRYRLRTYLRNKTYLLMAIIVPIGFLSFFLPIFKRNLDNQSFSSFERKELSSDLYKNQRWNYDLQHSETIKDTLTRQIFEQELPKQGNTPSLDFYSKEEMESIGQSIYQEPYYVSSISGEKVDNYYYHFTIYYNDSMPHVLPATFNTISNVILASNQVNDTIHTSSYPFNYFDSLYVGNLKFYALLIVCFCISFSLSFFGCNVVTERMNKLLKQLQLNGITNRSYWLSVLISDHIVFMVTCVLIFACFLIFKFDPMFHVNMLILFGGIIFVCGFACLLFQYCFSYCVKSEASALIIFFIINIAPTYLISIEGHNQSFDTVSDTDDVELNLIISSFLLVIGIIFPNYNIVRTLKTLISVGIEHRAIGTSISMSNLLKFKYQISNTYLYSIISVVLYGYLLIILTKKKYNPKRGVLVTSEEMDKSFDKELLEGDEDIYNEYRRVIEDKNNEIPIKITKLGKEYDEIDFESRQEIIDALERKNPKYGEYHMSQMGSGRIVVTPFKNISLGIDKRECFGILGPNGSGKSSLLNTTSFTFPQTIGDIVYDGKKTTDRKGNEITLGYCPQEDTLWDDFTLYEHIEMFLYLRGFSKKESKRIAKQFIKYCRLTEHKNKMPSELSGGTRRKLNILMALCCSSSKIILDEPTAGMDPSTRRYVWDIIKGTIQTNGSSTVMSTHSMEEAELLCNRIAIMVKGKIRCIGSPEHIKMKYGNTYILDVFTNDVERFHEEVVVRKRIFGEAKYEREDKSLQRVKYEVLNTSNIGLVFEIMESCRKEGLYNDYSYSQTSLEQVFLNFAIKYGFDDKE